MQVFDHIYSNLRHGTDLFVFANLWIIRDSFLAWTGLARLDDLDDPCHENLSLAENEISIMTTHREFGINKWIPLVIGPGQTSNFAWAELDVN